VWHSSKLDSIRTYPWFGKSMVWSGCQNDRRSLDRKSRNVHHNVYRDRVDSINVILGHVRLVRVARDPLGHDLHLFPWNLSPKSCPTLSGIPCFIHCLSGMPLAFEFDCPAIGKNLARRLEWSQVNKTFLPLMYAFAQFDVRTISEGRGHNFRTHART